jgi:hypothetical protein
MWYLDKLDVGYPSGEHCDWEEGECDEPLPYLDHSGRYYCQDDIEPDIGENRPYLSRD